MENATKDNAKGVIAGFPYVTKFAGDTEYKVIDLDDEKICPTKGIVEFEAIRWTRRGDNNCAFRNFVDPNTGIFWGIWMGVDNKTKEPRWQEITLKNLTVYDRANPQDRKKAAIAMVAPFREGSHIPLYGSRIKYRLKDKEGEAIKKLTMRVEREKASEIAKGLKGDLLKEMAMNLGIPSEGSSDNVTLSAVWDRADSDPKGFMKIWNDPNRTALTILNKARENGVVVFEFNVGYTYSSIFLGTDEASAVFYLSENTNVMNAIEAKTAQLIESGKTSIGSITDSKEDILQRKIEELQAQLAAKDGVKNSVAKVAEDDEHEELKKLGKEIGVKGWHLKSKENLSKAIKEKQAETA